ncbi:hypothetical protein [Streptomyces sp. NPDC051994]|uniref:hypothetical protein n=1 Tax=unclassified Streptomyces TaxID=2593676 RepID=UPI0034252DAF
MDPHPAKAYVDELLTKVPDVPRPEAEDFIRRVFDGGAEHGSHSALANTAAVVSERDAQIRRLAQRLESLGEDPLAIAQIISDGVR